MNAPVVHTCAGEDGTCTKPAKKCGLCWAHWKRRMRRNKGLTTTPESAPVGQYERDPTTSLFKKCLAYADAADGATEEEWWRIREQFRWALRTYVRKWAAGQLNRQARRTPLVESSSTAAPTKKERSTNG